jgi:regulator of sirC expression with transglutaminase-like and TPR domain
MALPLQFQAPSALQYFAALVAEDSAFPCLEAAVAIAQDDDPGLDVQGVLASVDVLAQRLKQRMPADAPAVQRLRLLTHYFFQDLGFAGNVNNYYDRHNSLIPHVLQTRRGIPISLAVLLVELAAQTGLVAQGISFPGHFLVKFKLPLGDVVIDPLSGQSLSREALEDRLLPFRQGQRQRQGLDPDDAPPLALFLQAASGRDIISRMLRNLKEIHRSTMDWHRLAAVQERLVLLHPKAWDEHRDLALALAELGRHRAAVQALGPYLEHCADAADAAALRRYHSAWQASLGGLH